MIATTIDKFFLPSYVDVGFTNESEWYDIVWNNSLFNNVYVNSKSRQKCTYGNDRQLKPELVKYALRSTNLKNFKIACVQANGLFEEDYPENSCKIAPACVLY